MTKTGRPVHCDNCGNTYANAGVFARSHSQAVCDLQRSGKHPVPEHGRGPDQVQASAPVGLPVVAPTGSPAGRQAGSPGGSPARSLLGSPQQAAEPAHVLQANSAELPVPLPVAADVNMQVRSLPLAHGWAIMLAHHNTCLTCSSWPCPGHATKARGCHAQTQIWCCNSCSRSRKPPTCIL
jgi:hypothetical protein